ncbi:MAG: phospho-N-acetylmuramoyl-pentapeptide-transferase [Streptococcaceae bacterium]|nr:phospho-N-acetylmuramoyl-pentapeptide-transferase [Streptococcaceae bacterium]MCL2681341.1 phospho-N-acetylmuramoyl-pentapeptide-transferase [Streptococcaceae bacterium]MCL2858554.1 phospho-N-acetylmuramoyl-pentapeptide-transferase [Streptococcaceae bacterium]
MLVAGIIGGLITLVLTALVIPRFILYIHKKELGGQPTLEDVKQHADKAGTPTMGGAVFVVIAILVSMILALVFRQVSPNMIIVWWVFGMYAVIGFIDDFLKVFKQNNQGLTATQKMAAQIFIGIVSYLIYRHDPHSMLIHVFGWSISPGIFLPVFIIIWLVGWSNAVNLTDGIDGLASINVAISLIAFAIIAYLRGQHDIFMIILAVIGALLGFFIFNRKPAKIFMGDVGSLALGALLAIISILLHAEWTLIFIGFIYMIETLSVMSQVFYFKATNGKRIFRMTPIHHHFELGGFSGKGKGWSEWKIDIAFWATTAGLSIIALLLYFKVD